MCVTAVNSWKWSKKQTGTSVSWQSGSTVCVRSYLKMSQAEEHEHITFVLLSTLSAASLFMCRLFSPPTHNYNLHIHRKSLNVFFLMIIFFARYWRLSDCGTVFEEGVWQPGDLRFEVFGRRKVHPRSQSSAENQVQNKMIILDFYRTKKKKWKQIQFGNNVIFKCHAGWRWCCLVFKLHTRQHFLYFVPV